jgi:hypothetical protein
MRVQGIEMGAIYCKHCMKMIDTQPTEKVTIYYSECEDQLCREARNSAVAVGVKQESA